MNRLLARYRGHAEPLLTERRVELSLLVLLALLLLQLLWAGSRLLFTGMPDSVVPTGDVLRVSAESLGPLPDAEARAEIRARPLFWEERRPIETAPTPSQEAAAEAGKEPEVELGKMKNVTLTGVFGSGDSAGIIYLAKGKEQRIMVGEEINGWKLESVAPDRAIFQGNGKSAELNLKWGTIQVSKPALQETDETPAAEAARAGMPATGMPATGTPAAGTPAAGTPAARAEEQSLTLGGRRRSPER